MRTLRVDQGASEGAGRGLELGEDGKLPHPIPKTIPTKVLRQTTGLPKGITEGPDGSWTYDLVLASGKPLGAWAKGTTSPFKAGDWVDNHTDSRAKKIVDCRWQSLSPYHDAEWVVVYAEATEKTHISWDSASEVFLAEGK